MRLVKMSSKGQIVIPKEARDKLGLKPNTIVRVAILDDYVAISPLPDYTKKLRVILKGKPSMTNALIEDHEKEINADAKISP